jgi:LCP family protein required for cell wall assembly
MMPTDDDRIYTILLLGGDGAPSRPGNRTDSMMLVMIDRLTGRAGLVSVPRNMMWMRFPPGSPLSDRYPDGFSDLANSVFTTVERSTDLSAAYSRDGLFAPAVAVAEAVGYSLRVMIDDFLFVDLRGFSDLIDAVGGVTISLDRAYSIPPNVADPSRPVSSSIGPGRVWMDGPLAMGYARTRYVDSDVGRTSRQRQIMAALAEQVSPVDVVARLPGILASMSGSMATSMDRERLMRLVDLIGGEVVVTESVSLTRPLVNTSKPDWEEVRWLVSELRKALMN